MSVKVWEDPLSPEAGTVATALIILNEAIPSVAFLKKLWSSCTLVTSNPGSEHSDLPPVAAQLRLCADGGANRLYDLLPESERHKSVLHRRYGTRSSRSLLGRDPLIVTDTNSRFLPDQIKGDLDSLREDVASWYRAQVHAFP